MSSSQISTIHPVAYLNFQIQQDNEGMLMVVSSPAKSGICAALRAMRLVLTPDLSDHLTKQDPWSRYVPGLPILLWSLQLFILIAHMNFRI